MTKQTIKLVDVYCVAANWQSSIDSNLHLLASGHVYDDEIKQEIEAWSAKRDKALLKLRAINAGLTEYEKRWICRKCRGHRLAEDFRNLGVEPSWAPFLHEEEFSNKPLRHAQFVELPPVADDETSNDCSDELTRRDLEADVA